VAEPAPGLASHRDDAEGILRLVLSRPAKRNALDPPTLVALGDAIAGARDDRTVRVVVLAAEGPVFSAGGDIDVMKSTGGDTPAALARLRGGLNRTVRLIRDIPKPVLAEVQGDAHGAGALLAFQCDLTVVAEEARFALSFRNLGLVPDTGGTWLLPRRLGLQRAKHMVWTGEPFTAKQAVEWGLALKAVPRAKLAGETRALAEQLAAGPTAAFGLAKLAMQSNLDAPLAEALDREARLQAQAFVGPEHGEGREAFFEKRKPDFRKVG
jgi:2-(1,2-epoxy-1,2-dihydrophenyl)acetyl-CoA isomerase